MAFRTVEAGNDWGSIYYGWAGETLSPGGSASYSRGETMKNALPPGKEIRVRLKDGSVEVGVIRHRPKTSHINDMGHEYPVSTVHMFVDLTRLGLEVPLEGLSIEIP